MLISTILIQHPLVSGAELCAAAEELCQVLAHTPGGLLVRSSRSPQNLVRFSSNAMGLVALVMQPLIYDSQ